jgi:leucine-zipper of insertion element IS481
MKTHPRAKLGPAGRLALTDAIANRMTQKAAAAAFCVAPATAHRWWRRRLGASAEELSSGSWLFDRSSRPHRSPRLVLDAALTRLAREARIVICGGVSQYNAEQVRGPANYLALIAARGSMTGMVVFDYADRYREAAAELATWLHDGRLVSSEHVVQGGVRAFPETLLKLFAGVNTGKLVLAVN